ncbi:Hypothetical protein NTJ_03001 [Nesidiocoris tenuis]|uniref:Uncharacterized protein n=1 Tax=Nesidiocoris tenuis TaxID=355587 RepID=A0ABN7AD13_9HEMI|nr:Hypothetical protein NTJ_03001 [Nesidiocoris tenuis]
MTECLGWRGGSRDRRIVFKWRNNDYILIRQPPIRGAAPAWRWVMGHWGPTRFDLKVPEDLLQHQGLVVEDGGHVALN